MNLKCPILSSNLCNTRLYSKHRKIFVFAVILHDTYKKPPFLSKIAGKKKGVCGEGRVESKCFFHNNNNR